MLVQSNGQSVVILLFEPWPKASNIPAGYKTSVTIVLIIIYGLVRGKLVKVNEA